MIPAVKHQGVMFKQEGRYDYLMLIDLFVYKDWAHGYLDTIYWYQSLFVMYGV